MTSVINIDGHQSLHSLQDEGEMESKVEISERACGNHGGICAICLDKIVLQETALIKGCEHAIQDYMFEESVCLLLRASWFMTLTVEDHEDVYEDPEDYYPYEFEDEDDDLDEVHLSSSSNLRIGNRRWGDNGYVRAGHQEARPVHQADFKDSGAGTSREPKKKEAGKDRTGRRAKRTLKREAAASKHQQHLARLGRK
ncbi:hypothetical protein NC653_002966 [Populus alba x Populus x berolinensis]|uniref:Uncharacterized protein n=1 Tax=Populus alba x Populus x berolinensis TaxID=444605 RepID=A0AAD6RQ59_9ROSI|nr:hypothetical protein NC653_002966 [Populus alba x Populus x berolinensis]